MKPVELDLDSIPRRSKKPVEPKTRKLDGLRPRVARWRRIIWSLRYVGPQTIAALAKNLHLLKPTICQHITFWLKRGIVEQVGRKYKLTDKYPDYGKSKPRKPPAPRPKKPTSWSRINADDE